MARHIETGLADDLRYVESARRVRARLAGTDVADSRSPLLVWEPRRPLPVYGFPREDVRADLLHPSGREPERAHALAESWTVRAGGREAEAAAWSYDDPDLANHVAFDWNAMDAWFEEEDEVFVHPRDPFHRVDVRASSRHVRIEAGGATLADSTRPLLLFETGLPTRYYLPAEDVRFALLEPTPTRTRCPYKGEASYWSAHIGDQLRDDLAWSYPEPLPEVARIRELVAFFNERVDMTVDGEHQERPHTPWWRPGED